MKNPVIILVAPQMGENIGAAARAMKNFGISNLRIVRPRDGWPNLKAENMAVGAVEIINQAQIYDNLASAVADIEYLYATTATPRCINKNYVLSQELKANYPVGRKTGIMFGRENCGLTNQEIGLANKIISINTSDFNSLNLAQSIVIICYELFDRTNCLSTANAQQLATKDQLDHFFVHLFSQLDQANFFKTAAKKPKMVENIINIFMRIDKLSVNELQTLRGVISSLTK